MRNSVTISMIWATDSDNENDCWLVAAWDEWSIEGNDQGWAKEVETARKSFKHVRLITTAINFDTVLGSFLPTSVSNDGTVAEPADA